MKVKKTLKTVVQLFPRLKKKGKAQKISRIKIQYSKTNPMILNYKNQVILKPKSIIIWKNQWKKTHKNKFSRYFKLIRTNLSKIKTIRSFLKEKAKIMKKPKNRMILIRDYRDKNKT